MTSITIMNILLFLMPYLLGTIIGYNAGKRKYVQLYYNWKRKKAWMKIKSNRQIEKFIEEMILNVGNNV